MINRDISNNIKSNRIYKRIGLDEDKSKIPKFLIKAREKFEFKLSMALLSPNENQFQIYKFKRILNKLEETIESRLLGGEL